MTCHLCSKVAFYMVPFKGQQNYYCGDHKDEAYSHMKRLMPQHDRPHYPEVIGGFTFHQRIWR